MTAAAERWDPPRVVSPRPDSPDHEGKEEQISSIYQPITYLCTTWKLLLGIIAAKISRHMTKKAYDSWILECLEL